MRSLQRASGCKIDVARAEEEALETKRKVGINLAAWDPDPLCQFQFSGSEINNYGSGSGK